MKNILTFLLSLVFSQFLPAQIQGKITYKETVKLDIQFEGMDDAMKAMLPESQSLKKELLFSGSESVYQNIKGEEKEDLEMESDDGSFKIKMISDNTEDILYKNLNEKQKVHQKGMMGKSFVVSDELTKHKWKITNEKIKYLDYECQKAVIEEGDKFIVAWFTSQIPAQFGPGAYHGLPGAILMLSIDEGKVEIQALSVDLELADENLVKAPHDGKKVNQQEYEKIKVEKEAEMREMYGDGQIKIRN